MAALLVDLAGQALGANLIPPSTLTGTTQSSPGVDFSNSEVSINMVVPIGTLANGLTTASVQLEESTTSASGGPWTVIPGMIVTATTSNQLLQARGLRTYRYVRANAVTATGTTISVGFSVQAFSQYKYSVPGSDTGGVSRSPST